METPNFNIQTVSATHDDLLTGIKTKEFVLNDDEKHLWEHLPNIYYSHIAHQNKRRPHVRVVVPIGEKAYSHGRVIRDGKLVFTYKENNG